MTPLLAALFVAFPFWSFPLAQSVTAASTSSTVELSSDCQDGDDCTSPCPPGEVCETRSGSWIVVPIVFLSPETDFTFGVGYLHSFFLGDPDNTRLSASRLAVQYSLKQQIDVRWVPRFYFPDNLLQTRLEIAFTDFPNSYWGVGPDTAAGAEETYTARSWLGRVEAERRLTDDFYLGGLFEIESYDIIDLEEGGLLDAGARGRDGGLVAGLGLSFAHDTRDSTWATHRGQLQRASVTNFGAWLGSDFDYTRIELESSHFLRLGGDHILAGQVVTNFNFGSPPFERLALLGGDSLLRGYFEGRYRDSHMAAAQLEYRTPFLWRFGLAAFLGVGWVFSDLNTLELDATKLAGGVGLRFAIDLEERIHIRVDFGQGLDTNGLYISFGEAF